VKLTQRKRTNADRTHLLGVLGSVLLATIAVVSIAVGALAWSQPRTDVVRLSPGVPASLTPSPLFDPGSTVFAQGEDEDPADPASWGCVLLRDGAEVSLQVRPDFDAVGSRVLEGEPYVPVVAVGTTVEGDRLRCDPATADTVALAVMPTDLGVRAVPLAFVVGGIAALGIAGLLHPRGRGIRRFGS